MKDVAKMIVDEDVTLKNFDKLGEIITFKFLPSGIVIVNGVCTTRYSFPTLKSQISPAIKQKLTKREYHFIWLEGEYKRFDGYFLVESF